MGHAPAKLVQTIELPLLNKRFGAVHEDQPSISGASSATQVNQRNAKLPPE